MNVLMVGILVGVAIIGLVYALGSIAQDSDEQAERQFHRFITS